MLMQTEIIITAERPDEEDSQLLLASLRAELAEKYPDELRGFSHSPNELMIPGAVFLVARRNKRAWAGREAEDEILLRGIGFPRQAGEAACRRSAVAVTRRALSAFR